MNSVWLDVLMAVTVAIFSVMALRFIEQKMRVRLGPIGYLSIEKAVEVMKNECDEKIKGMQAGYEIKIQALRLEYETKIQNLQAQIDFLLKTLTDRSSSGEHNWNGDGKVAVALPAPTTRQRQMLVVIGQDDTGLKMDFSVLRRARIPFTRLSPATLDSFEAEINRARRIGDPYAYIHISAHAGEDGVQFSDGLATPEWLAERLRGVEVVLIAGCEGTNIGDTLGGIAEYVITMAEPVRNEQRRVSLSDIGIFSEVFWSAVWDGKDARTAFYTALDRSPSWIGEIAHIHAGITL